VVARVRLVLGGRGSQGFLLKLRQWTQVIVNEEVILEIILCFMTGRIS
jgi:hypothetical protein